MRYIRFLVIPAAFLAGVYAVNSVQAQTYSKTGYNPAPAGSVVTFSYGGATHTSQASNTAVYSKTGPSYAPMATYQPQVQYAPTVQYVQPQQATVTYTQEPQVQYAEPEVVYVDEHGQPISYDAHSQQGYQHQGGEPTVVYGEPRTVVVQDTSGLPGYGSGGNQPAYQGEALPADAFPPVYAQPGTASYILQTVTQSQGDGYGS